MEVSPTTLRMDGVGGLVGHVAAAQSRVCGVIAKCDLTEWQIEQEVYVLNLDSTTQSFWAEKFTTYNVT